MIPVEVMMILITYMIPVEIMTTLVKPVGIIALMVPLDVSSSGAPSGREIHGGSVNNP